MSGTTTETAYQPEQPEVFDWDDYYEHVVTEDDEPVDSIFSAKQQTLLKRPLYASWTPPASPQQAPAAPGQPRIFLADVNVGIFREPGWSPIVPDFFLSLDVKPHPRWHEKRYRSYFLREFGKPPEVTVEIVSDEEGGELSTKLEIYARIGVRYYVVFDPFCHLSNEVLQLFELDAGVYRRRDDLLLPEVGLRLVLWEGGFEGLSDVWLRWCTPEGGLLPLGQERAAQAENRAAQAEEQAATEAAARRQAEEQAATEAAARRQAEEQAATEAAARRQAEEQAATEAAARRQAEEQAATEAAARRQAEEQAATEAAARQQAEARGARLAAKLRELGLEPE